MIRFGLIKFLFTILSVATFFGMFNGTSVIIKGWELVILSVLWIFTILLYTPVGKTWQKKWNQWNERYREKYHKLPVRQDSIDKAQEKNDSSVSTSLNSLANIAKALGQAMFKNNSGSKIYVEEHQRKDGTKVKGHYRNKKSK